jgi:hypothetical protein
MKKKLVAALAIGLFISISGVANSAITTSLYGDKDGFGVGFTPNQSFSTSYPSLSKNDPADTGTITDSWLLGDQTWSHTYDISGFQTITSASIEVFTLGQGWHGISSLYIDGSYVGNLTDGDNSGAYLSTNWARLDIFDLMPYSSLLDGANSIKIDTYGTNNDQWALDYSVLSVSSVPIPGAVWLLGSGIAGVIGLTRKRKK